MNNWINVKDYPLYKDRVEGGWITTEAGCNEFLAAVPYEDNRKPNETLWWIRHCVIEDERGLCVVGDDYNECAGWELKSVTHYQPLPSPPHTPEEQAVWDIEIGN